MAPPSVDEPFIVMADAGDDPLVTCSGSGPFPLSALEGPPDVDPDSDDPLHQVLLSSTFEGGQPTPQEGWRTLWRTGEAAEFYLLGDTSFFLVRFDFVAAGWVGDGHSSGGPPGCRIMLALPDGVDIMNVALDPDSPPDPTSTTLHLLVNQRACSGGSSGVENMRPPEIIESDTEIRVAIAVVPPEGNQTCPGNPPAPIEMELDSPIGDRTILDGLRVPPIDLELGPDF
ncbi:MAG: hypothetical protein P8J50_06385 [Acidimicrobiales bacterium]|jgi:hypothetical protein|nr:hypothetical protein [Acidimicrobiales bacterium]